MKITAIKTVVVNAKLRNWIFVRVETDVAGLVGLGEATLEFQTRAVVGAIEDLAPLVIGQDPRRIEHLWQAMYRYPFFKGGVVTMSALSGIDQALHDLKAKDLGVPLWQLLGGLSRDRLRMYDHLGGGDWPRSMTTQRLNCSPREQRARAPTGSRRSRSWLSARLRRSTASRRSKAPSG